MNLLTDRQAKNIVVSVLRAVKYGMPFLQHFAYRYINLCSGFIAHYDLRGFIYHYTERSNFKDDILSNQRNNQWDNFHPGENDYEYYMQKRDIYNEICERIKNDDYPELPFKPKKAKKSNRSVNY